MRRFLYILGILLVILLGVYFQCKHCCDCTANKCDVPSKKTDALAAFSFKDGDFKVACKENFNFKLSSYSIEQPVPVSIQQAMIGLKSYLTAHSNKTLKIKGYYAAFEKNNSIFPNLGLARANAVKGYLIGKGLNQKQLEIEAELSDKLTAEMVTIKGGTTYDLVTEDEQSLLNKVKSLKIFGEDLRKEPVHLHFATGQTQINPTAEEREKIQKISEYLSQVDNAVLLVVGHTDNTGERDLNVKISKERADFVKEYLIKNDFATDEIETRGEGPDHPIADNATEEGRAKNRRVTLTLK